MKKISYIDHIDQVELLKKLDVSQAIISTKELSRFGKILQKLLNRYYPLTTIKIFHCKQNSYQIGFYSNHFGNYFIESILICW